MKNDSTIEAMFNKAVATSCGCRSCLKELFDKGYKAGIKRGRELERKKLCKQKP